jgi:hypothetical protein
MFQTVQELLKTFTANDKKPGGSPGFTAVLHTHSRTLGYHPHIHVVMPGTNVNLKAMLWKKKSGKYLFSHKALAKVFRAKLLQVLVENTLPVPPDYPEQWVVHCKPAGNGEKALVYLGRYLYRGVMRQQDILHCRDGMVPSTIAMPKAAKTGPEPSRANTSSTSSHSISCPKDSGGQGRIAFSIHAAKNSSVFCNWCCGLHPGAALSVA